MSHPGPRAVQIVLSDEERRTLERWAGGVEVRARVALRELVVVAAAARARGEDSDWPGPAAQDAHEDGAGDGSGGARLTSTSATTSTLSRAATVATPAMGSAPRRFGPMRSVRWRSRSAGPRRDLHAGDRGQAATPLG